jgi:hypothetical protein
MEYAPWEEPLVFMRSLETWFKAVQVLLQNDFFLGVGDAILLTISMKYMFLMKGNTVYAGVCGLNNHIQTSGNECMGNGALCLHFYLSPSASRFDGSVASTKSADNNMYTQVQVNRDTSKESMVKYLVQCDGSR